MEYTVYRLEFQAGVHFGGGSLWDSGSTLPADTVFSALCQEAAAEGGDPAVEALVAAARSGALRISDLMPVIDGELYLPKPLLQVRGGEQADPALKKLYKKLQYIALPQWKTYLRGELDPRPAVAELGGMGRLSLRTLAALRAEEKQETGDTLPYQVGVYHFRPGCGLYLLAATEGAAAGLLQRYMQALAYSGLGGKRSAGLGRFTVESRPAPAELAAALSPAAGRCMSLSLCMEKPENCAAAMEGASYLLMKRSGFVASDRYAPEQRRKRDFYAFRAGACFARPFAGDVFEVGGGAHPVYRYAIPLWMEMEA